MAGYFAFMALYMFSMIFMFFGAIFVTQNPQDSSIAMIFLIVFLVVFFVMMIIFALAMPTYHLFAMIAVIQVARGKDYRYPLLGKFLARRMGYQPPPSTD